MRLGKIKHAATTFLDQYKQQNPATYAAAQQAIGSILIVDGFIGIDNPFSTNKRPGIFGTIAIAPPKQNPTKTQTKIAVRRCNS